MSTQALWDRFWQAGRQAYAEGKPAVPSADEQVQAALVGLPVGSDGVRIMRAWLRGWHSANLADPAWMGGPDS